MWRIAGIAFLLLTFYLSIFTPVEAHLVGQPPFFKINGVYSNLYPVPTSSIEAFNLPQDLAADNYIVGQNLDFEFDEAKMPAPKDVIEATKFFWDYGDGSTATGLKNSHQYTKPGSYILAIKAQYKTDPQPQLIQSVLFNILPSKGYKLPQAVIRINGRETKDPLADIITTEFNKAVTLDGSGSTGGSSKIVSYSWDLGDTNPSTKITLTHQYDTQLNQVFPVLRVKDENGLVSDQYVEIENGPDIASNPAGFVQNNLQPKKLPDSANPVAKFFIYGLAAIISVSVALLIIKLLRKKKRSR